MALTDTSTYTGTDYHAVRKSLAAHCLSESCQLPRVPLLLARSAPLRCRNSLAASGDAHLCFFRVFPFDAGLRWERSCCLDGVVIRQEEH